MPRVNEFDLSTRCSECGAGPGELCEAGCARSDTEVVEDHLEEEIRIFEVHGPPKVYVIARDVEEARAVAEEEEIDDGFEVGIVREVLRLEDVDGEWWFAYPYQREDRNPYVYMNIEEIFRLTPRPDRD